MITDICIMRVLCDQCRAQSAEFAAPTWEDCRRAAQAAGWGIEINISQHLRFCPACREQRQPPAGSLWAAWQAGEDITSREAIARREAQAEAVMAARWQMAREVAELRPGATVER